MRKFRLVFLALALILIVGMTTGLIVRKQTGGQTVMQHSAQVPEQTTPATTVEDPVVKILLLVEHDDTYHVTVTENEVDLEPIDSIYYPLDFSGNQESKGHDPYYVTLVDRYVVDPSCTSLQIGSSAKSGDVRADVEDICVVCYPVWSPYLGRFEFGSVTVSSSDPTFDFYSDIIFAFVSFGNAVDEY